MSIKRKIKNYINETEIPKASDVLPFEALNATEKKKSKKSLKGFSERPLNVCKKQ